MNTRLKQAIEGLEKSDYGIILKKENIYYLTGFFPTAFSVLALGDKPLLYVSEMDEELAKESKIDVIVVKSFKKELHFKGRVGVEKRHTTLGFVERFLSDCEIFDIDWLDGMREIKDQDEIESIKRAISITEDALKHLELDLKERSEREMVADLTRLISNKAKTSFEPIVASGVNASVPHHTPTYAIVEPSSMVLIDAGARVNHYNCDMTRTFSKEPTDKFKDVYRAVLEAQREAIKEMVPGTPASQVDKAVRRVLAEYGFEEYFIHSTGHGVGLEVHEAPRISKESKDTLKEGMVVSIEPGVYIPGWGGVRIEDVVLVGSEPQVLTSYPKYDF